MDLSSYLEGIIKEEKINVTAPYKKQVLQRLAFAGMTENKVFRLLPLYGFSGSYHLSLVSGEKDQSKGGFHWIFKRRAQGQKSF